MSPESAAITVEQIGKRYRLGRRAGTTTVTESAADVLSRLRQRSSANDEFWALRDVSLEVGEGEVLGLIGPNGAGKSTLLKILSRITVPTEGRATLRGHVGSLLEVGTGFHAELSGRDNIYLNGAILGMKRKEIVSRFDEIVEFAGIGRFIDVPVKRYSSGMYVRLAFSVAAHFEPEILLVDEVLSVGDQAFQQKCLGQIDEIAHSGRTVVFVSHNLAAVSSLCTRACFLAQGRLAAEGEVDAIIRRYLGSVQEAARRDLHERADRQGSGAFRFTKFLAHGPAGAVTSGGETWFDLDFAAVEECKSAMVGIAVYGLLGEPLFLCSTKISGDNFSRIPRTGTFRCVIPRLPLAPGRYSVNVYGEANGAVADWVSDAATFDVAEGDFFGSGQLPPTTHGHVFVDHAWGVEERADGDVRRLSLA